VVSRQEKNILSNEDWYPTIAGPPWPGQEGMVRVSLIEYGDDHWRVCVWGGDDFGMERDFPVGEGVQAVMFFDRIVNLTTKSDLRIMGFVNA
jgi:hypothetical protein